ncbi:MAG: replicative DNA helicase [Candidatus Pacebacteria bacterium]|nr:replicative DNA helicase [Candidatus Paceibacterota bacterium]
MTKQVRIPPQDLEAEQALLGSIMLKSNSMYDIADTIVADAFYASKHRIIFEAMHNLFSKGEPIDMVTLSGELKRQKQLKSIGSSAYLSELTTLSPSSTNITYYADIVKSKYTLRSLIAAADEIGELGYAEEREIDIIVDEAQQKVYEIANSSTLQKFTSMKEAVKEAFERLDKLKEGGDQTRGVPSGFKQLDNLLSGFQKSDLVILAARPSVGKTTFALDIARQAAVEHKVPVGIFSLEMSSQQLTDRLLSSQSKVDSWKLRTGKLSSDDEYDRIRDAMGVLEQAPIYIDDNSSNTVLQMRATCRRLKAEKDLGLIVIDYLQLITPSAHLASAGTVQQITEISRSLKGLARELDVPVLALSQLSRAVEARGGTPRLSDLRDSGSIEQDADVVMFIHRDDRSNENSERPNIADIMIEKHRNGPVGKIELYFDEKHTTFIPLEKNDFNDFNAEPKDAADDF